MIRIWLIFLLSGITMFGFTQKDQTTKELLKAAADKALGHKTIKAEFEFIIDNAQLETKESYKGKLWIKGSKFKMDVDQTVTFCDGKNKWVYLTEVNEVNISVIEKGEDLNPDERFLYDPLSIFTLYKNGFKYITSGTQKIEGKIYTVIDLSPEDKDKPFFKIKLWISEDYNYYAVKYFQKDGTRITLQLKDFKTNEKIGNSFFVFDAKEYPNVEIIDLRE